MAARAGRDPAAQRRILEALRKMPQCQRMRLQLCLQGRAKDPSLDASGARGTVDLPHAVQMPQVERDRRLVCRALEPGLYAADHAAAAAEWGERRSHAARPVERGRHLAFIAWVSHDIGRLVVTAEKTASIVRKRLTIGMGDAIV